MALDLSPDHLLHSYGYAAVLLAPLVESTGVPFPGEAMLLLAAAYAADTGRLSILGVIAAAAAGAILGDNIGYGIGRGVGHELLRRYGRYVLLTPERLSLLHRFFRRRGALAVVLARFIVVLRTFTALVAGAAAMDYRRFLLANAAGGALWAVAYGLIGFELGRAYHHLSGSLNWVAAGIGLAALVVALIALALGRRRLERWAVGDLAEGKNQEG